MNNSVGPPGPQWNGSQPQGQNYQAYNGAPEPSNIANQNAGQRALNTQLNSGHMNPNLHQLGQLQGRNQGSNPSIGSFNSGLGSQGNVGGAGLVNSGINPNFLQRTGTLNTQMGMPMGQNFNSQVNDYPPNPGQLNTALSTPGSAGARFPAWDMDIPSQMFMQAINFEQFVRSQGGGGDMSFGGQSAAGNVLNSTRLSEDSSHKSEAGLDLLEQQQAVEQARLLQRFKELRHWQQQQQEVLMSQQQQQLSMLRQQQEKVQSALTKQRGQQWGVGKTSTHNATATPPKFQLPPGMDMAKLMASGMIPRALAASAGHNQSQSDGGLPKPVIYVEPRDDDDEIKTNPDLFSDTNSNRGSQAAVEEGVYPIPDSASEASVDVRQFPAQPKLYQPRYNKHITESPRISHHHSVLEAETDDDQEGQSFQSPTLPSSKPPPTSGSVGESVGESSEEGGNSDENEEGDSEESYEDMEENEEEEEEEQTTQIEVHNDGLNYDEIPIKTASEGPKSFEQLVEEQLRAEEERLQRANANTESPSHPKRQFLKKGEGIARFEVKPGQRPPRPRKPTTKSSAAQKSSGGASEPSKSGQPAKSGIHGVSKSSNQSTNKNQSSKTGAQSGTKKTGSETQSSQSSKPPKGKKSTPIHGLHLQKPDPSTESQKDEGNLQKPLKLKKTKAPESIPDDTSFIASLKERQKESERDLEELDEFEILEDLADNMSFCSNSSIVTKGLYSSSGLSKGLQSDRILAGMLPKASSQGKPKTHPDAPVTTLGAELNQGYTQAHQAVVKPFNINSEIQDKLTIAMGQKPGENVNKNVNAANKNNNSNKDVDDVSDDEGSTSETDSDEYTTESESEIDEDNRVVNNKEGTEVQSENGANSKPTHNQFIHVGNKGINLDKDNGLKDVGKAENRIHHSFDKERKMLTFSDTSSEFNESENEDMDIKHSGHEIQENYSPTKVLTRKVAGRDDRKAGGDARTQLHKVSCESIDAFSHNVIEDLDSSSFAPKAKSPFVISKEKVLTSQAPLPIKHDVLKSDKFVYHSDSDSNGGKVKDGFSDGDSSDASETELKTKPKTFYERKTLQFDDDSEWDDKTPVASRTRKRRSELGTEDHDKTLVEEPDEKDFPKHKPEGAEKDTPPTSKLVTKLFPKLKTQQEKQHQEDQSKIQTASQSVVGDGIQSKALRDKLIELEREIEKFRNENSHLAKLRSEREESITKLKREIAEFDKEKTNELRRLEEFKNEELKKIKHERKMFDKYQKAARACPDKKEREEIETLKSQLSELQEEMKRKESRWSSNNSRLRSKIEQLEQENEELKDEIKMLEKKRLEWLQKDQNKSKTAVQVPVRSSTPTPEEEQLEGLNQMTNSRLAANFAQAQFNDLSTTSSIKSNVSLKPIPNPPKVNVRSSFPPHSKGSVASSISHHSKNSNNVNQSAGARTNLHNTKVNKSKSNVSHNTKHPAPNNSNPHQGQGHKKGAKFGTKIQDGGGKVGNQSEAKILRTSLTEDVPRRELATVAAPQDVSIYSEADEVSIHQPTNMPRKTAGVSKLGVDRSLIDKGDNDYEETQHSDGKVERVYNNGAREILFSNGTRKEISADGQSIVVSFFNGDMKQIMPDQRVVYYYAEVQTTHINYPDGLEILQFPNNQTEKLYPDGTKEITFTDQTIKYVFPNGSEESIFPDGTVIRLDKNGDKTMEFPNGQREIHTQEYKKREYPDGTVKTVYPDGRQETRYSNGRLRVKDKDGNIIVDRHY